MASTEAGGVFAGRRDASDNTATIRPATGAQRDLAFRRDVVRLHKLGPRVLFELFAELGARRTCRTEIEALIGTYAALDPDTVRAVGADRLPPRPPLRLVRGAP